MNKMLFTFKWLDYDDVVSLAYLNTLQSNMATLVFIIIITEHLPKLMFS